MDATVPLSREEENNLWEVERQMYVGERRRKGKKESHFRYGRWGKNTQGQEYESKYVAVGEGELGIAIRKSLMPRTQEIPWIQKGELYPKYTTKER